MGKFSTQTGSFDYVFGIRPQTGSHSWTFSLTYDSTTDSLWESPFESFHLSGSDGIGEAVSYQNGNLALGNPLQQRVNIYESDVTSGGALKGGFQATNYVYPFGVTNTKTFGCSAQMLDSSLYVGADQADIGSVTGAGAVFLFPEANTGGNGASGTGSWGQGLYISGTEQSGFFGASLSRRMVGPIPVVAVGATGELSQTGRVYLYRGGGDTLAQTITPTGENISSFGRAHAFASVSEGDNPNQGYLAVSHLQAGVGKVNIYRESRELENDYTFFQTLTEDSTSLYGASIQSFGTAFMIGSPLASNEGAAYFYEFNFDSGIFTKSQTLTASNIATNDHFGKSLDFTESLAMVGSNGNDGSVYVFEKQASQWVEISQFSGSETSTAGSFAGSISGSRSIVIDGERAIVGAQNETEAYVFTTGASDVDDYTGLAFSGSDNKIYDSEGNFLYGCSPGALHAISGSVMTGGYYSIYVDDNLYRARSPREPGIGLTGSINDWAASGLDAAASYYYLKILEPVS